MKSKTKKVSTKLRGFTLMELLIVCAIIAILVVTGVVSYKYAKQKTRNARRTSDLSAMSSAIHMFYEDTKSLPINRSPSLSCAIGQTTTAGVSGATSTGVCLGEIIDGNYMQSLPVDPLNDSGHSYAYYNYVSYITLFSEFEPLQYNSSYPYGWHCDASKNEDPARYCDGFLIK